MIVLLACLSFSLFAGQDDLGMARIIGREGAVKKLIAADPDAGVKWSAIKTDLDAVTVALDAVQTALDGIDMTAADPAAFTGAQKTSFQALKSNVNALKSAVKSLKDAARNLSQASAKHVRKQKETERIQADAKAAARSSLKAKAAPAP
jgi:hypothetical protein